MALEFDRSERLPTKRALTFDFTPLFYALKTKFMLATVDCGRLLVLGFEADSTFDCSWLQLRLGNRIMM